ncbi:DNA-binding SARP family transcriptional activator/tetratricopeptide (TPR) repeat protein [Nonomuraea thailandensis]|uniref:DNA-binding SARP family transcriptional activator/tetratricopeptide (TPR) repeat protein n=1 Tax=Nonomuraea thailandensis TaxID=1188745 RepID=A0A9X2K3U9_9ACTN|nr:BTAD domain-containing putative transcriptional regulator [Nonomuraea thailandensis]MCP2358555.1 DNA-binding SARP family transcriptional activator/tetratricopeptide (TPR) repeat protein [Nonomuraea thailandensis]
MGLEIRFLGPWEIAADDHVIKLAGQRRIGVLARLAVNTGQAVHTDRLLADVWAHSSAATAAKQLHIVISKLRETLAAHAGEDLIETLPGAYRLALPRDRVDAHLFSRLVLRARAARAQDAATADTLFRQALGLWRGPALDEVDAPWARIEAGRLAEERLSVLEEHIDLRLAAGDHPAVARELAAHVKEHPLRERLAIQLMLALHRDARSAEALDVYQDTRRLMVTELGIEPGNELRRLHQAILARDPALDLGTPAQRGTLTEPIVPAELPAGTQAFTARAAEVERLRAALVTGGGPTITVIDGPGGIGKSALAVHVAHAVAGRFTDGVVYVNLHGATAGLAPLTSIEALRHLLRSLGLDGAAVPADPGEAAARYRSLTAAGNLLVILDNAHNVRQVRPLIPGGTGCRVLITSRDPLTVLDNSHHLHLGTLADDDAAALLTRVVDAGRVRAEPEATAEIVRLCGGFPLALRIAGARLAARPDGTISDLAVRLADATRRLDLLEYADLAVRAGIAVSHQHLREEPAGRDAAHLLALLGLLELPTHTTAATAALAGWPEHRTEAALERLLDARLLEPAGPHRYQFHDLVRLYTREQELPAQERAAAIRRALHHYLATAVHAEGLVGGLKGDLDHLPAEQPGEELPTVAAANAWVGRERDNLLAAVRQAAGDLADRTAAVLANATQWLFDRRGWFSELIEVSEPALRGAEEMKDWAGKAFLHQGIASAQSQLGRSAEALRHLEAGLVCCDLAGKPDRKAGLYNDLGILYAMTGRYDDALAALERALAITVRTGRGDHESFVRNNRVHVHYRQGRFEEAVEEARHVLAMTEELDDTGSLGIAHDTLGDAYRAAGRLEEAVEQYRYAVKLQREMGFTLYTAVSSWWLGRTLHDLGRPEEAWASWRVSLDLLREARLLTAAEVAAHLAQPVPDTPEPIRNQL